MIRSSFLGKFQIERFFLKDNVLIQQNKRSKLGNVRSLSTVLGIRMEALTALVKYCNTLEVRMSRSPKQLLSSSIKTKVKTDFLREI